MSMPTWVSEGWTISKRGFSKRDIWMWIFIPYWGISAISGSAINGLVLIAFCMFLLWSNREAYLARAEAVRLLDVSMDQSRRITQTAELLKKQRDEANARAWAARGAEAQRTLRKQGNTPFHGGVN